MPSSRYSRDDADQNNYGDARPERRRDDRRGDGRVQDVSYSEIGRIRTRDSLPDDNLNAARRTRTQDDQFDENNGDSRNNYQGRRGQLASTRQPLRDQDIDVIGRRRTQEESDADSRSSRRTSRRDRYADDDKYDHDDRRSRRRQSAPDYDYGGGERSGRRSGRNDRERERDRGSRDDNQQVARSQQQRGQRGQQQQQQQRNQSQSQQNESQEDNQEPEKGFFGRNFDRGSDGIITAAAGAALGAITARHFFGPKEFSKEADTQRARTSKHWKMVGGAVLGAAAFNAAETKFHNYFEEQEERHEDAAMGMETAGEMIGAMGPDVL